MNKLQSWRGDAEFDVPRGWALCPNHLFLTRGHLTAGASVVEGSACWLVVDGLESVAGDEFGPKVCGQGGTLRDVLDSLKLARAANDRKRAQQVAR